jgi:hypothetical protein
MSKEALEKAIKIIKIFDEDGISNLSKTSFNMALNKIKFIAEKKTFNIIASKSKEMIEWLSEEIITAKANDLYSEFTNEELDHILKQITKPEIIKLIKVMAKPSDSFYIKVNSLDIELVSKIINVVKNEDKELANDLDNDLKEFMSLKNKASNVLN